MEPLWLAIAFVLGFAVRQIGLPPLVGFLAAGFVLNAAGIQSNETLEKVADFGVMLLLFSIGLKLKIRQLLRPEVWAAASIHMLVTIVVFGAGVFALGLAGFSLFRGLDVRIALLIGFALSFSSTVFAVKVLEEKGEMYSLHGRVAIGILIMQDLFAVLFLTATAGKLPSPWALALLVLVPGRFLLMRIMDRSGHGELLVLLGWLLPIAGAWLFTVVGLKADLGALILGVLLADHEKADELAKALLSFKDLFLVGFFLTIGLSGTPSLEAIGIAFLLTVVTPLKVGLFFLLLTRFRLRARTATLTSLSLANYSEFGLIIGAVGAANNWLANEWLVIFALSLSITFIIASPLNTASHAIYARWHRRLQRYQSSKRLPGDELPDTGEATVAIFGMGRVGTGAYDDLRTRIGDRVIGIDNDPEAVKAHCAAGRMVIQADATDSDFWERIRRRNRAAKIQLVLLTMANHSANLYAVKRLKKYNFPGMIAATAKFEDELDELEQAGASISFNFYAEAGAGFAEHVFESAMVHKSG